MARLETQVETDLTDTVLGLPPILSIAQILRIVKKNLRGRPRTLEATQRHGAILSQDPDFVIHCSDARRH
jgi:hypothetical protein